MSGRSGRRVWTGLLAGLVVLALVAGAGLWLRAAHADGRLNSLICDGGCGPSAVAAPDGLAVDGDDGVAPQVEPATGADPDPVALQAAVDAAVRAPALGPHVGVRVTDLATGRVLAEHGDGAYTPASTTKVLTGFAALATLDPDARLATRTVLSGDRLVLVGGGDPFLLSAPERPAAYGERADLRTLARRTARELASRGVGRVRLGYDTSLFEGPAASPAWAANGYVRAGIVAPVSALWVDRGTGPSGATVADPAAAAAAVLARELRQVGVDVVGAPAATTAAGDEVARVTSATVRQLVEVVLRRSDNEGAEVLLRHVGRASGQPASFAGGAEGVEQALRDAGVDVSGLVLGDGSGLARGNRIAPATLTGALEAASRDPRTSALLAGLPVAGFDGTLADRFDAGSARDVVGLVRAKTGTLTGVHALAGVVRDPSGRPLAVAVMADRATAAPGDVQAALDSVVTAVATTGD